MKFTRPSWVVHRDSSAPAGTTTALKALTIFSLDVHPDDSRIATGGLDQKVRIWSTAPILDQDVEEKDLVPKSQATLSMHAGPVLCVRWAHSGRWLASGSDDSIILIWDLDPNGGGKAWGTDDVNHEGWKAFKRLPGHESDVTGLAWSPGDRYLASVGLDSVVMIWDGYTLDRLQRLDQHSGFVKGVCWDPAGEFLASCSDDKTVKIFKRVPSQDPRYPHIFVPEASIDKPFVDSPANTFFRRLSWSPDGAHITVANATNGQGLVYVAAVISRRTWDSAISLVGHGHTVQAVAFNPHIFLRDPSQPASTANICSVVALGGDDCSVSVWQTKSARPLVVARDAFGRGVLDLSWSSSGRALYGCSSDGTVGVFEFTSEELEGMTSHEVQEQYLRKFSSYLDLDIPRANHPVQTVPQPQPSQVNGNGTASPGDKVTTLIARKGKSKKTKRVTLDNIPSASVLSASNVAVRGHPQIHRMDVDAAQSTTTIGFGNEFAGPQQGLGLSPFELQQQQYIRQQQFARSRSTPQLAFRPPNAYDLNDPFGNGSGNGHMMGRFSQGPGSHMMDDGGMGMPSVDALPQMDDTPPRPTVSVRPRTLGGDRIRENVAVRVLESGGFGNDAGGNSVLLEAPPVTSGIVKMGPNDVNDMLESKNFEEGQPSELEYMTGRSSTTQWLDYLPSPVIIIALSAAFAAAACVNGTIGVYSLTGRKLMPTIMLGEKCAYLECAKDFLMAVTTRGAVHVWNTKLQVTHHPPTSVLPLLASASPNTSVHTAFVRHNGAAVVRLSSGSVYSYDISLLSWVLISDSWWSMGSEAWGGTRGSRASSSQLQSFGILAAIESGVAETATTSPSAHPVPNGERPSWWGAAMTLGHLEGRLHACKVLDSPAEYKQALRLYAAKLADEGFRSKAEELIRELCGPLYLRPGREEIWSSSICGLSKRDLLKEVLSVFARSKTLTKLGQDWQEVLRKAAADD